MNYNFYTLWLLNLNDLTTRLRNSDVNWQLSEKEKNEKRLDWCKKTINNVERIIERYYADNQGISSV